MSRRIVLVLSGGGALGAYQCGAYRALTRRLNADARRSMVIVGASIGAVNGFLIATRSADPDAGVAAMERFWRSLTIPSAQFFPVPDPYYQRLNATLTGLVFGNPFAVVGIPGGLLGGLLYYPHTAAFSHANLISATREVAGDSYSPGHEGPRLIIRAIDIAAASPVWFDSNDEAIVPSMIGASSSIPLLFKPVWHDERAFWDGDIWHQGILTPALNRLVTSAGDNDQYHVVTIELFKRTPQAPEGFGGNLDHFRRMLMGARSDEDADSALNCDGTDGLRQAGFGGNAREFMGRPGGARVCA